MTLTPRSTKEAKAITVKLSTNYDLPVAARPIHCASFKFFSPSSFFSTDSHEMANFSFDWTFSTRRTFKAHHRRNMRRWRKIEILFMRNRFMSDLTWRFQPLDTLHTLTFSAHSRIRRRNKQNVKKLEWMRWRRQRIIIMCNKRTNGWTNAKSNTHHTLFEED